MLLSNYFLNISSAKSIPYLKNYNILNPFKNFSSDLDKIPHRICRQELSSERKLRVNGQSGSHKIFRSRNKFSSCFQRWRSDCGEIRYKKSDKTVTDHCNYLSFRSGQSYISCEFKWLRLYL